MVRRSRDARQWMYNRFDEDTTTFSDEFVTGVDEFMQWVKNQPFTQSNKGKCYCPCDVCKNDKLLSGKKVVSHLYRYGFTPEYYVWFMHGEEFNVDVGSSSHVPGSSSSGQHVMHYEQNDRYVEMVNNAFPYQNRNVDDQFNPVEDECQDNISVPEEPNVEAQRFYAMLDAANVPLYDGCRDGHSQLSLASRLMHTKTDYNLSERCMDSLTDMFSEYLPAGNNCPASYYETEKLMRNLGLPYHAIDVCINNCMIFWKEDDKFVQCRFCGKDRYQQSDGRARIPWSRMWYMPVTDRIKRLYQSPYTAEAMRWHAEHDSVEGELSHPSDAAEWKNFNLQHPTFASEKRNVYLGLCTDGFNPFGMQRNHSLWPVILTPYNLPPGMCMKEEFLWLTILNSGPSHPRASLDIFLRPLIDELKDLWSSGVVMYDVSQSQNFNCRVALLWTISDFPAYGMLSGWTTHGRLSCPICMDYTDAFHLPAGRKTSWFDCHRRFLPHNHTLRRNKKNFRRGRIVNEDPPLELSGIEVLYERVRDVKPKKTSDCGGNGHDQKADGYGQIHNWHKESIFWELPYWEDLSLRHNLDVMHIEKNFFDNIIHTIMNVKEKSKDNVKARTDLVQFCSRKELHLDSRGVAPVPIFRLSAMAKQRLLQCVKHDVQFPDGYAADLATCADIEAAKFVGMKSHDCHVFMERLFPFIFAELLPKNVHLAISGIGGFFRDLCSRTLQQGTIDILKDNIVLILCNLEKIFPPAFFDVMEHLPIHLPREAELGGPVQYRWMYPFERFFKKLKSKAKNKRYAAGSIVQSYLKDEISFFTEHYFASHIQTKNNTTRFAEGEAPTYPVPVPDMFTHIGRPSGKKNNIWLSEKDYNCAHAYILRNCEWFRQFESMFETQTRTGFPHLSDEEVFSKTYVEFPSWMKNLIQHNPTLPGGRAWPIWVKELVEGPSRQVTTWPMYITRGYLFHTRQYGQRRKTCNYGVIVRGNNYSDQADEDDFHGVLTDIIEVQYGGLVNLKLTLFKCDWYDPTPGRGTRRNSSGGVDVMSTGKYNTYEPFILASQAEQVCYIRYPHVKQPRIQWLNVCKVNPRENITGAGKNESILLQQDGIEGNMVHPFEDLPIDNLVNASQQPEPIAYEVNDDEPEDEFCDNMSSSEEDEENDE